MNSCVGLAAWQAPVDQSPRDTLVFTPMQRSLRGLGAAASLSFAVSTGMACGSTLPVKVRAFNDGKVNQPLCFLSADAVIPDAPLEIRGTYKMAVESCKARAMANGVPVAEHNARQPGNCHPVVLAWSSTPVGTKTQGHGLCLDGGYGTSICSSSTKSARKYWKELKVRVFADAKPKMREVHVVSGGVRSRSSSMKRVNLDLLCEGAFQGFPRPGERRVEVPRNP